MFSSKVSICILMLCVIIPCLFYVTQRTNQRKLSLYECFYLTSSIFLQDPINNRPFVTVPSRITLATWSCGAFIIVQIITGVLRSNTAVKKQVKLLNTFQEIVDNPEIEPAAWDGTPTMVILEEKYPTTFRIINDRIQRLKTMLTLNEIFSDQFMNKVLDGKSVYIQEPDSMLSGVPRLCDRYSNGNKVQAQYFQTPSL